MKSLSSLGNTLHPHPQKCTGDEVGKIPLLPPTY